MVKRLLFSFALRQPFSAPAERGTRTAAGGFAPNGRQSFQHRLSGEHELPQAGSLLTGGGFSLEIKRGIRRLRTAGACRAPRQGKRVDTKVSTLLTPTSFYFLVWRRLPTCDRSETGERQRIFSSVSFAIYSQGRIHYCYTDRLLSAGATYSCCATRKSGDNRRHLRI